MRTIEGHKGCYEYTTVFTGLEGHASRRRSGRQCRAVRNTVHLAAAGTRRGGEGAGLGEPLRAELDHRSGRPHPGRHGQKTSWPATARSSGKCARSCAEDGDHIKSGLNAFVEEELKPTMRRMSPEADIVTHVIGEVEGLQVVPRSAARDLVFELTGADDAEVVAFGTEAGLFQSCGISTVICGPGSIEQAHKPDEYIEAAATRRGGSTCSSGLLQRMSH